MRDVLRLEQNLGERSTPTVRQLGHHVSVNHEIINDIVSRMIMTKALRKREETQCKEKRIMFITETLLRVQNSNF